MSADHTPQSDDSPATRRDEGDIPTVEVSASAADDAGSFSGAPAGPAVQPAMFAAGTVLADRYRLIRFVARGGMGDVYEAEDLTLRGRLALKTIRPAIAENPTSAERFKREIHIARRITHPNVSRIYDLGIHRGTPDTMFLTMEFLAGDNLYNRIVSLGAFKTAEALPVVEQIASGLAAAHDAGVIHRDFKSANVMLVPLPNGKGERAIVTDFGLARPSATDDILSSISETGFILGTPAYMAPEQVEGKRLTPAADIYALGVVMYEMVTGRRPFIADTPMALALKRLTDPAPPPRNIVPTLDPGWNATILRCLDRDPEARYSSALDVVRSLHTGETPTLVLSKPPKSQPRWRKPAAVAAIAIAGATTGSVAVHWWPASSVSQPQESQHAASAIPLRRAIAVLPLRGGDSQSGDWASAAMAQMLIEQLEAGEKFRVIKRDEIARACADVGLASSDQVTPAVLAKLRNIIHADDFVTGDYSVAGEGDSRLVRVNLRVVNGATGNVLASSATSGTEAQLFDLVSRAVTPIRQKLGMGDVTPAEAVAARQAMPSNRDAQRLFVDGLARMDRFDNAGARTSLAKAATFDANSAVIHASLASANSDLGRDKEASVSAERAVALATELAPESRLRIESEAATATKSWERTVAARKSLWQRNPDSVTDGVELADAQIQSGRSKEALVTVASLRKLPSAVSADPRIDFAEARAYQDLNDFSRVKQLAASAAAKARAIGSRRLQAEAQLVQANALISLGETAAASSPIDEARAIFAAIGDRGHVARALELTAAIVDTQGDLNGERRLLDQALEIHRAVNDQPSVARVLLNIGTVLVWQGNAAEAKSFFDDALKTFRQAGLKYNAGVASNQVGAMMFDRGDLKAAEQWYQQALSLFGEVDAKGDTATALSNVAEVLECRGDLDLARKTHEDALAIHRSTGDKSGTAYDLFRIGDILGTQGDFAASRDRLQEAIALQNGIGEKLAAADTRVALARIEIGEGDPAKAEKDARDAEQLLRVGGEADRSALANAVAAEALLAQQKTSDGREAAGAAWKIASKSKDRRIRFAVAITVARAKAASRKPADIAEALSSLESIASEAMLHSFAVSALEARLARAEIEVASGNAAGRKDLSALAQEAKSRGFGAIARRASAVQKG